MALRKTLLSFDQILGKLMRYCSYQERSIWEVRKKANELGVDKNKQGELIEILEKDNFLNELRFAKVYVSGKQKIKKWGKYKLKEGLLSKGVSSSNCEEGMKEIDQDLYLKNLKELIDKKGINLKESPEDKPKLYRYLLSKGYESELILKNI